MGLDVMKVRQIKQVVVLAPQLVGNAASGVGMCKGRCVWALSVSGSRQLKPHVLRHS